MRETKGHVILVVLPQLLVS